MAVRVGINGFGRIGRQSLKAIPASTEHVVHEDEGDLKDCKR